MNQKIYNQKMKEHAKPTYFLPSSIPNPTKSSVVDHYLCNILLAPGVTKLIGTAAMEAGSVKSATDYSYSAPSYGDCGYRIIGDAGGELDVRDLKPTDMYFASVREYLSVALLLDIKICPQIDPFFSSGVHLALTSALSAASTICASIRGDCSEAIAADWHTKRVSTSYTRCHIFGESYIIQR
jgi:hypothetical protein